PRVARGRVGEDRQVGPRCDAGSDSQFAPWSARHPLHRRGTEMSARTFAISIFVLLAGCAHSSLVLLPDEDGGHGQVAILESAGKANDTIVGEANSRTARGGSKPAVRPLGANGLKPAEASLVSELPPPAKSFTLYFLQGTTEMTPESMPVLEELRSEIAKRPGAEVQVTGHTDTVGSDADNDAL